MKKFTNTPAAIPTGKKVLRTSLMLLTFWMLTIIQSFAQTTTVTNPTSPWTAPAGATSATIMVWGGGGGGGGGWSGCSKSGNGGGGGGGGFSQSTITVAGGQAYTITVGTAGTAGTNSGGNGGAGGTTTVTGPVSAPTVTITATGGGGGTGGSACATSNAGGGGGAGTSGQIVYSGGAGSLGGGNTVTTPTGAGGGGASLGSYAGGSFAAGTGGTAGTCAAGTGGPGIYPGGAGSVSAKCASASSSSVGVAGIAPGGGGSGGQSYTTKELGGAGGAGQVMISYTITQPIPAPTPVSVTPTAVCAGAGTTVALTASGLAPGGQGSTSSGVLTLNGTSQYVTATGLTNIGGAALTIEYWFKGSSLQSAVRQQAGATYIVAGWNNTHILSNDAGTANGVSVDGANGTLATNGQWHHICMTWAQNVANTGFCSYFDGCLVQARTSANVAIPNQATAVLLGSYIGASEFTNGSIDNVRIWSVQRTQAQILADMFNETPTVATGLTAQFKLNGDFTCSNNVTYNGTATGSPTFAAPNYYTYTWTGSGAPAASTNEVQTATPTATGAYTVVASHTGFTSSASSAATSSVTVNALATPGTFAFTNGSAQTMCSGSTVSCANVTSPTAGSGSLSVVWYCGEDLGGGTWGNWIRSSTTTSALYTATGGATPSTSLTNYNPLLDFPGRTHVYILRRAFNSNCGECIPACEDIAFTETINNCCTAPTTSYTVTGGGTFCSGGSGVAVGLSGSQGGGTPVSYQLYNNGVATGSPVVGTGSAISFGNQTAASTGTGYTVSSTTTNGYCAAAMTGSATVTVQTGPTDPTGISGSAPICASGTNTLSISGGSDGSGSTYQWYNSSTGCGVGTPLGTSSSYTTPTITTGTTYYVRRVGNTTCSNTTNCASQLVTVNPTPTVNAGSGPINVTQGSTASLTGTFSGATGVQWTSTVPGTFSAATSTSTTWIPTDPTYTGTATLTLTTTGAPSPCTNPSSNINVVVGTPLFCPGMDNGSLTFTGGTGTGSNSYQISIDGGTTYSAYTAGSSINTDLATGDIKVKITRADANCTSTSTPYTLWTLDPTCCRPPTTVTASVASPSICSGTSANLQFSSLAGGHFPSGSSWQYQWEEVTPSASVISAWSSISNFTTSTLSAGTYTFILKVRGSSCTSTSTTSNTVTVTVSSCSPPVITSFSPSVVCSGSGTAITITGTALNGTTAITVSGTPATTITNIDATHVSFVLPSSVTTSGSIVVTNGSGSFDSGTIPLTLTVNNDATAPTHDAVTVDNSCWILDGAHSYNITIKSTENGTGIGGITGNYWGMAAVVNFLNTAGTAYSSGVPYGGFFSWNPNSTNLSAQGFTQNTVTASGTAGGTAAVYGAGYGNTTITLNSCAASYNSGTGQYTVVFNVTPNSTFPVLPNNVISMFAIDNCGNDIASGTSGTGGWGGNTPFSSGISVGGSISGTATVCSGVNSGTLTLSGYTGSIVKWQYSTNGGTSWTDIANTTTTQTYTNLTINTIYQAIIQNGSCSSATSGSATITVTSPTANAGSGLAAVCPGGTTAALGGSVGGSATGGTWTDGGAGGSFPGGATNLNTIYTASATAGTVTLTLTSSGGSCGAATASKSLTVNPNPTPTAGASVAAICQNQSSAALNGTLGTSTSAIWSDGGAGGSFLNNGGGTPNSTIYTAGSSAPSSVTLTLTGTLGSCTTVVTKTQAVNTGLGTAPTGLTETPSSVCAGATSVLTATSSGNLINWYTASTGGTSLGQTASGGNFTTPALNGTTTFYAETQLYTAAGSSATTFNVPANVTSVTVVCYGGGGGGGGARYSNTYFDAGGGGGGAYSSTVVSGLTPGQPMTVVVGTGGAGGANTGANGNPGGTSTVTYNSVVVASASGGSGGNGCNNCGTSTGGAGGSTGTGTVNAGGAGGNGHDGSSDDNGGAGGGCGGPTTTGGTGGTASGGGATAAVAGAGGGGLAGAGATGNVTGSGGVNGNNAPTAGPVYGGGGGGAAGYSSGSGTGGSGAAGYVLISWSAASATCPSATRTSETITVLTVASNAGTPQMICSTGTATLAANNPSPGAGLWTIASGPAGSFSLNTSNTAVFTPTGGVGTYVLTWTITTSGCTSASNVTIIVTNPPTATIAGTTPICSTGTTTFTNPLVPTGTANATGGDVVATVGGYKVHTFNNSGTFTAPTGFAGPVEVLVVGGGGGGGTNGGGGGGGGAVVYNSSVAITSGQVVTVTIGTGGAVTDNSTHPGVTGGTSSFGSVTAAGGGGGAGRDGGGAGSQGGLNAGGGGGGGGGTTQSTPGAANGTGGAGGNGTGIGGTDQGCWSAGGGGGGANSSAGTAGTTNSATYAKAGNGGAGIVNTISGAAVAYGGGGGGNTTGYIGCNTINSNSVLSVGTGGVGGGGNGNANGTANTGGGAGSGGAGGSGIVIVRYPDVTANAWTSVTGTVASVVGTTGVVSAVGPGTSSINYTISNGLCTSVSSKVVTVSQPLSCSALTVGGATPCVGIQTVTANPSNGVTPYTYIWTQDGSAFGGNTASINSTVGTHTYACTVTDNCGANCSQSTSVTTTALPVITVQPATPSAVCAGTGSTSISVTATGASVYTWRKNGIAITAGSYYTNFNTSTLNITNPAATENGATFDVVVGNGTCSVTSSPTVTLTVNAYPAITVQPAAPAVFCGPTATRTISVTATGTVTSYQWRKNGTPLTNTAPYSGVTTAILTVTNPSTTEDGATFDVVIGNSGCTVTSSPAVAIAVKTLPTVTVSPTSANYCTPVGPAVTLTGGGAVTYAWSAGLSATSGASVTASPATTATYTVTGTDANTCTNTATTTITAIPSPSTVTVTPSTATICNGGAGQALTASGGTIGSTGTVTIGTATTTTTAAGLDPTAFNNRYSQYWCQMVFTKTELLAAGLSAGNITSLTLNITGNGDATTNANFRVYLGSLPVATTTLSAFTTSGLTLVYGSTATTYTHAIGTNLITFSTPYSWDGNSNILVDLRHSGIDNVNNAATYYTAATSGTIISAVTTTAFSSSDFSTTSPAATQSTKRLNVVLGYNNSVATTFSWAPSGSLNTSTGANVTASPTTTTTYSATSTSAQGCANTGTSVVTVNQPSTVGTLNQSGAPYCTGVGSATLTQSGGTLGTGAVWQWYNSNTYASGNKVGGQLSSSNASLVVNPTTTTTYYLRAENTTSPCTSIIPGSISGVTVTVNQNPTGSVTSNTTPICSGFATNIILSTTGSPIPASNYNWTAGASGSITGQSNVTAGGTTIAQTLTDGVATAQGTVTYTVTPVSSNGCLGTTFTAAVLVNPKPILNALSSPTICSGTHPSITLTSSSYNSVTYSWLSTAVAGVSGNSTTAHSGTPIQETLINNNSSNTSVTYTVTPTAATCVGNTGTTTVTIRPTPTGSASPQSMCSADASSIALSGASNYTWTDSLLSGMTFEEPSHGNLGQTIADPGPISTVVTNSTDVTDAVIRFKVTPISSFSCNGTPFNVDLTIHPAPTGYATPAGNTICSGSLTGIALSSPLSGTTFDWTTVDFSGHISGYADTTAAGGSIPQVLTSDGTVLSDTVEYTIIPVSSYGCSDPGNNSFIADVYVNTNPSASMAPIGTVHICQTGSYTLSIGEATSANGTILWTHNGHGSISGSATLTPTYTAAAGDAGHAVTLTMTVTNGPCTATATYSVVVGALNEWLGATSSDWSDGSNWCGGLPTSGTNVVIPAYAVNMPLIGASGAVCNNVTVNSGATLSMNTSGAMTVSGNWIQNGTFTSGGGMVTFAGTTTQSISGTTTFDNVYIGNPSGVLLNNDITVNSVLELDTGNVVTGSHTVDLGTSAYPVAIGGFVDGNLQQYIPSGFFVSVSYPIGSGSNYTPLDLTFDNVYTDGYITAHTTNGDHASISSSGFSASQTVNRTWTLSNSGVTFDQYSAGLTYLNSDKDLGFVDAYADTKLYSAGSWIDLPNDFNNANYESVSNIAAFGDFQIGTINPIPSLYSLSPALGSQTQTLDVVFNGAGFITGASTVNAGTGITVNTTTVNADTMITANVTISSTATLGAHPFSVTNSTPGGGTSGTVNFTVSRPTPTIDSLSPSHGIQGHSVFVVFHGTGYISGLSTVNVGASGITLYSATVNSGTMLTAHLIISPTATVGLHPFSVTNGGSGGLTSNSVNFTVQGPIPTAKFSANNLSIYCNADGTTTFTDSSTFASTHLWNFGTGASPATSTGTGPITVSYTSSGLKTVKLVVTNAYGSDSLTKTNYISVNSSIPANPLSISGLAGLCNSLGNNVVYTCLAVTGATSYAWTIPAGITYVSGQGTTSLTVNPTTGFTTGTLSVVANNGCGASGATSKLLSATPPVLTGSISGPAVVCGISTATYSVAAVAGVSSYSWTVPSGVTITSGQGTTTLVVNVAAGTISGNLSILATSGCGSSSLSMTITKKPPVPTAIIGSTSLCGLSTANFSVAATLGATSYTWTVPSGITIASGSGSSSINVNVLSTFVSGNITVIAVNTCGSLGSLSETVYGKVPAAPTSIAGPVNICGLTTATYTSAAVAGATGYTWTLPSGMRILSGSGTSSITVLDSSFTSGSISVAGTNICGTGTPRTLVLSVAATAPGTITGPTVSCGLTSAAYSIASVTGSTGYTWSLPAGATISSGQGSTGIVASFSTPISGSVTVTSTNGCTTSAAKSLVISKSTAAPGAITGPANGLCAAGTAIYTTAGATGATGYTWFVPTGMSIVSGLGTTSIHVNITTLTTGTVKVNAQNTCGSSTSVSLAVTCASPDAMNQTTGNMFSALYPNPTANEFTIEVTSDIDNELVVEVYDVLGNLLKHEKHELTSGVGTMKTNIEDYKDGIYFVRVLDNQNNVLYTQRVIKQ